MLNSFFFKFDFHRFCQSGCYLDFFVKKFSEVFLRNFFIYSAQFFGEKYMIEILTKKIFKLFIVKTNKFIGLTKLFYSLFFIQVLSFCFYGLALCFFLI